MPELAVSAPQSALEQPKPSKRERIPKRISHAIETLISGECKTIKAAAEKQKLSREHLSRMLSKDHIRAFYERRTRENIGASQMVASAVLTDLMENAESEHVRKDVAIHALSVAGIKPADQGITGALTQINVGYVINLAPRGSEQGEAQRAAHSIAQVIEHKR